MEHALLKFLIANQNHWMTIGAMQEALGLTPNVIIEQIGQLSRNGYVIESSPAFGFKLPDQVIGLTAELIEDGLPTKRVGRGGVLVYESTNSTNDVAWHYAQECTRGIGMEKYDGLAVFAESQRAGRGRLGRQWSATAGSSVLCSVLLMNYQHGRVTQNCLSGSALTFLVSLSVSEAIERTFSIKTRIKWPNDVIVEGKKIAGVMVETKKIGQVHAFVLGMGINCSQTKEDFPPECRKRATSIRQVCSAPVNRLRLARKLLTRIDYWLDHIQNGQTQRLHDAWTAHCDVIHCRLSVVSNGQSYSGRVVDVSVNEGLIMQLDSGPVKIFDSGTTTLRIE